MLTRKSGEPFMPNWTKIKRNGMAKANIKAQERNKVGGRGKGKEDRRIGEREADKGYNLKERKEI